ncbi:MAG: hypothetical protein JNK72_08960 [Myxococcales bacterium]|nr:hypothetical protein [Myxococcales bacterium]
MARDHANAGPESEGVSFEEPTSTLTHTLQSGRGRSQSPSEPPIRSIQPLVTASTTSRFPVLSDSASSPRPATLAIPPPPRLPAMSDDPQLQAALSADLDADLAALVEERAQPRVNHNSQVTRLPSAPPQQALFDDASPAFAHAARVPSTPSFRPGPPRRPVEATPPSAEATPQGEPERPLMFEDRTLTEDERAQRRLPQQFTFADPTPTPTNQVYVHWGWVGGMIAASSGAALLCWYLLR